ncbi:MAG: DUF4231 domain-containing protein [Chloroflexota bacterium]|nr:MAG: DUF4231 domain-containing protein [Chloroflexota bacterium]
MSDVGNVVPEAETRKKKSYWAIIDELDLDELQKDSMRARWLDQRDFASKESIRSKKWHVRLRTVAIVGGVIVPALVALNLDGELATTVRWLIFAISLVVAIAVALEELFSFGEGWLRARRTTEMLKAEFWQFVQKAGPYARFQSHRSAYDDFAVRVELIIHSDVELFITQSVQKLEDQDGKAGALSEAQARDKEALAASAQAAEGSKEKLD